MNFEDFLDGFRPADDYVCDRFQKLSDWLQDITGKTCFWFALLFLCFREGIQIYSWLHIGWHAYDVAVSFFGFGLMFYSIALLKSVTGRVNPLRVLKRGIIIRVFSLCGLGGSIWGIMEHLVLGNVDIAKMYSYVGMVMIFIVFNFLSCTPRPWSKNRAGKWLDAVADFLFGRLVSQST